MHFTIFTIERTTTAVHTLAVRVRIVLFAKRTMLAKCVVLFFVIFFWCEFSQQTFYLSVCIYNVL